MRTWVELLTGCRQIDDALQCERYIRAINLLNELRQYVLADLQEYIDQFDR